MWRKEDSKAQGVPELSTATGASTSAASSSRETFAAPPVSSRAPACLSQGLCIRGEVTGAEDLFLDGEVEGRIDLGASSVTIGPNGRIKADITAREIIVRGRVDGKVSGHERVQLWSTGRVVGDVTAERLAIEDGAILSGKVEAGKRADQSKGADAFKPVSKLQGGKNPEPLAVTTSPAAD